MILFGLGFSPGLLLQFPLVKGADVRQNTGIAFGIPGSTHIAAMQNQIVVGIGNALPRNGPQQLLLHLQKVLRTGQTNSVGDPEDMCIHGHPGLIVKDRSHHICGFATDTGQLDQVIESFGDKAFVFLTKDRGGLEQMTGFIRGKRNALDKGKDLIEAFFEQALGPGKGFEKGGSHHIHPLVGALRGQHHGHQQLPGILIIQFRHRIWNGLA